MRVIITCGCNMHYHHAIFNTRAVYLLYQHVVYVHNLHSFGDLLYSYNSLVACMRTIFYIELNLEPKAMLILLCIAEQYLHVSTSGTLCFCLSPVGTYSVKCMQLY